MSRNTRYLKPHERQEIFEKYIKYHYQIKELAKMYDVSESAISYTLTKSLKNKNPKNRAARVWQPNI